MRTQRIEVINIGLIFFSFILALKLPFELFIFSYVILGPLHYLTELNWLKKNNYFVSAREWILVFILLSLLISIPSLLNLPAINIFKKYASINILSKILKSYYSEIILIMFLFAIGLVYLKKWQYLFCTFLVSIVSGFLILKYIPFSFLIVGVFLPTIVHVYLFTLLFMIYGNLNNKSKEGIIGIILIILCPILIFCMHIIPSDYIISTYTKSSYLKSKFSNLTFYLAKIFIPSGKEKFYFLSEIGIKIQIFIAFCYTYHYLNWFSKTSIIGWSRSLSKTNIVIVLLLWSLSILLYLYDFKIGYTALFFFSIIHVVLEFPLNILSIRGIINKMKSNVISDVVVGSPTIS